MADVKDILPDLDRLDTQLDDLEDALAPLLNADLNEQATQLPLLDKAKLFSLTAYAIESLLFAHLRLQGTDATNHAVYAELKRVQQSFSRIQAAEQPAASRTTVVNREGTARVLKAALADDKTLSSKLAQKIAEERAKALLKSVAGESSRPGGEARSSSQGKRRKGKSKK